ncbi:uroporphyrinogen-III synthase [Aquincola sp. S2]|uniref:Uroporphyrinogen-III synthase n=2 Tax=Pseudaquabacterium terrae TaxID=2732868 RepID=A0ABX2EFF3_9BURK|nr:uroporphyrinogen-III synthase [Aquabacterium terrae]
MRVLVTRPQPQADEWVARLEALGVEAAALPLLHIGDAPDAATLQQAREAARRQALVMFVSPSAVDRFFAGADAALGAAFGGSGPLAGSTGPGTQAALLRAGVPAAAIVSPPAHRQRFDSEALWRALLALQLDWRGRSVLIVRGEGGRDWLAETLRQQGAEVHFVEAYRRAAPRLDPAQQALLADALARPSAFCWLFSSSEAVRQLPLLAPQADWPAMRALATHERIVDTARSIGFGQVDEVGVAPAAVAKRLGSLYTIPRP